MPRTQLAANPFALMMDPDAIFAAIERSERLQCLKSRICRPLDEPRTADSAEARGDDAGIESIDVADMAAEEGASSAPIDGSCSAPIAA